MDRALREYLTLAAIGSVMLMFIAGIIWYLASFSLRESSNANQWEIRIDQGKTLELFLSGVEFEVVAAEVGQDKQLDKVPTKVTFEVSATGRGENSATIYAASEPVRTPANDGARIEWKADLDDLALARGIGQSRMGWLRVEVPPGINVRAVSSLGCHFSGDFGNADLGCETEDGSVAIEGQARSLNFSSVTGDITILLSGYAGWVSTRNSRGKTVLMGPVGKLEAKNGVGGIQAKLETAPISANLVTQSGDIVASGLSGQVRAESGGGTIRLAIGAMKPNDSVRITTESGNIEAFLLSESAVKLDAVSDRGITLTPEYKTNIGKGIKIEPSILPAATVLIRSKYGTIRLLDKDTIDPLAEPDPDASEPKGSPMPRPSRGGNLDRR